MRKLITLACSLLCASISQMVLATPSEIIIIRHGDKLIQKEPGPTLSSRGMLRSITFATYFLNKFGDTDYIVASDPVHDEGKNSSIRELQTIAPLANQLAARHAKSGFSILHPYGNADYAKLANYILTTSQFNGKKVLICWDHTKIPQLAKDLGVKKLLEKWPSSDFDTVFILKYDKAGHLNNFEELHNQYPVPSDTSWKMFIHKKVF